MQNAKSDQSMYVPIQPDQSFGMYILKSIKAIEFSNVSDILKWCSN